MKRYESELTPIMMRNRSALLDILLFGAVFGLALPWLRASGAALAPTPYDLAEWMSLHPTVRATSNILLPALLLRLLLVCTGVLCATHLFERRWLFLLPVVVLWLGMIPPVAFFRGMFSDVNYAQQFVLWAAYTLMLVLTAWLPTLRSPRVRSALALVTAGFAIAGTVIAQDLFTRYEITVGYAGGVFLTGVCLLLYVVGVVWKGKAGSENHLPLYNVA